LAKNLKNYLPVAPIFQTLDLKKEIELELLINNESKLKTCITDMFYSVEEQIAYLASVHGL